MDDNINKIIYETTLELLLYQDSYDKMLTIKDIKPEVEKLKQLISEEYIPENDKQQYLGSLKALEWVLNGSETKKEKLERIPHSSRNDVTTLIKELNNKYYKQMSIYDLGIKDENNS